MNKMNLLDQLGILTMNEVPPSLSRLSEDERHLLTTLFVQSEKTLLGTFARKHYSKECLVALDIAGLTEWQADKTGKPYILALTWAGEEAAAAFFKIAKSKSLQRK